MKAPGLMLAAPKSGSGKTLITCALLTALQSRGLRPAAFKCGPDYIDPMFHREVIGVSSRNLDGFFSDEKQLRQLYLREREQRDLAVVEGVMGLYDGLGGIREEGSAYAVASTLRLPVILTVDAHGMGRSLIPLLAGFLQYDRKKLIKGVILNRVSASFYASLKSCVEEELQLPVLGYFPVLEDFKLESRHLGLKMPREIEDLKEQLLAAAARLQETACVEELIRIANAELPEEEPEPEAEKSPEDAAGETAEKEPEICIRSEAAHRVRLAVARDEAFCFYYEDNLRLLREAGAELLFFSPLRDPALPENIHGLLLGGGYPELYAAQLEANASLRKQIREAVLGGMPSVAECGGFLYLLEKLRDKVENEYNMCGVLPGEGFYTGKLVRFGYVSVQEQTPEFLPENAQIKGHEFHYYDSTANGEDCIAGKPASKKRWPCVHTGKDHWWGFPHLYYPSEPAFPRRFVEAAKAYRLREEEKGK